MTRPDDHEDHKFDLIFTSSDRQDVSFVWRKSHFTCHIVSLSRSCYKCFDSIVDFIAMCALVLSIISCMMEHRPTGLKSIICLYNAEIDYEIILTIGHSRFNWDISCFFTFIIVFAFLYNFALLGQFPTRVN